MICYNCNKEIDMYNNKHIHSCDKETRNKIDRKILLLKYNNILLSKETLIEEYINNQKSIVEISKLYDIKYIYVVDYLDYYNITKRNLKESTSTEKCLQKRKETTLERYGVDNAAKSIIVKEKVKNTFLKNYGVSNIFKTKGFKEHLPKIMMERYGVLSLPNRYGNMQKWWDSQTIDFKKSHMKKAHDVYIENWYKKTEVEKQVINAKKRHDNLKGGNSSGIEDRVSSILDKNGITHIRQKWIKRVSFDILIENTNIIIEVNGDYWHANPEIYNENDVISYPMGKIQANEIWLKDVIKKEIAETYGYKVFYIWEKEINIFNDEDIYYFISKLITENYEDKIY